MNYKQSDSKRSKLKRIFKKNKVLVDGIRQGQELDELVGHQFERGLHENNETEKGEKESIGSQKITPSISKQNKK